MKRSFKFIYMLLIYCFLYIPIAALIGYSFNNTEYSMLWQGFTTNWYRDVLHDSNLWVAVWHSFYLAIAASSTALLIGTLAAVSLCRYEFRGKSLLRGLLFVIILTPDIVLGIALLILFSLGSLALGFWSLYFAHVTFCIPFVVVIVLTRAKGIDPNIFAAASDLGANEIQLFWRIIVPMLLPAILSSALLCFALSFDDIVISYFVSGPGFEILPIKIFSMARLGVSPKLNTLCSLLFFMTFIIVCFSHWFTQRRKA
ncbi:MAG: ydcV [Gammaproteobacteria bacterium]|nr:ydcV [Gammaproteobacteria bacterium]